MTKQLNWNSKHTAICAAINDIWQRPSDIFKAAGEQSMQILRDLVDWDVIEIQNKTAGLIKESRSYYRLKSDVKKPLHFK